MAYCACRSAIRPSATRWTWRSSTRSRTRYAPHDGARCIVITGSAGMFSSGYDIGEIPPELFAVEAEKLVAHPFSAALAALDEAEVPTLAALCGSAIGGGLELALGCDLRIASERITLGMPPAKLGLIYSHTGLRRFLDAIGEPRTRELFLLGRYIDAPTALSWGLVELGRARTTSSRRPRWRSPASSPRTRRWRSAATRASCASCSGRGRRCIPRSSRSCSSCASRRLHPTTCARA